MKWREREGHVPVKVFFSRQEAEFAQAKLRDSGIPCQLFSDDSGSVMPVFQTIQGVALYVPADLQEQALNLLEQSYED